MKYMIVGTSSISDSLSNSDSHYYLSANAGKVLNELIIEATIGGGGSSGTGNVYYGDPYNKGSYSSELDLLSNHPNGSCSNGDYAIVSNHLYYYDSDSGMWVDSNLSDESIVLSRGPIGERGADGSNGPDGMRGETGATGATGDPGPNGTFTMNAITLEDPANETTSGYKSSSMVSNVTNRYNAVASRLNHGFDDKDSFVYLRRNRVWHKVSKDIFDGMVRLIDLVP